MAKISVIVPIYNVSLYIEKCVRSLMTQTLDDIEYIFVNDCTPDNSIEILENTINDYPERIHRVKIIHHNVNMGLTNARNSGLAIATGEYIAHCDSDDWVESTMYEELYNKAIDEQADLVYCDIRMVFENSNKVYNAAKMSANKENLMRNYIASVWTCLVNLIAKKELYQTNKLSSPTHISYCEDFWLSVRLFYYAVRVSYINKAFYNYNRANNSSIVHKMNKVTEKHEQTAYLETIDFFKHKCCLEQYEMQMSWRILKSKQDLVLDPTKHSEFLEIYPTSHRYIWSCPYINIKNKIMMWLLVNHLTISLNFILKIRCVLGR